MPVYKEFKNLTANEFEEEEFRFNLHINNTALTDEAWIELAQFFDQNAGAKNDFRLSYWRWFVILSWQKIYAVSPEMFLLILQDQVPVALLSGVDVLDVVLRFLEINQTVLGENIDSYFSKIRLGFLSSEALVGEYQGQQLYVKELVLEYSILVKKGADSMEKAEFFSKVKQIFSPKESYFKNLLLDTDQAAERFVELINFFQDIDNGKKIKEVLDMYMIRDLDISQLKTPAQIKSDTENKPIQTLSLSEIKSQIESEFSKNESGEFQDVEAVLNKLQELSEQYNNPEIANLLYFDEQDAQFKWNI